MKAHALEISIAIVNVAALALAAPGVLYQRQLLDESRAFDRAECWEQVGRRHERSWQLESTACRSKQGTPGEDTSPDRREINGADGKFHCLLTSTFYCFGASNDPEPTPHPTPHPVPPSSDPRFVGEAAFPLNYWRPLTSIAMKGTRLEVPVVRMLNASVAGLYAGHYQWTPSTGAFDQLKVDSSNLYTPEVATYLGNDLILGDRLTLYKNGDRTGFLLYRPHPSGSFKILQLESSGSFLYALSQNDNAIQIVNTEGRSGWEQVLSQDSVLKLQTYGDGMERFTVNDKWLVMNESRPTQSKVSLLDVYDVSDPYSPRKVTRISLDHVKVNELNGWHPIVSGDRVFVPEGNKIVAKDLSTGAEAGEVTLPEAAGYSKAWTIVGGRLYVGGHYSVHEISLSNPLKLELVRSFRVTRDAEAKGIVLLHHDGNSLFVVWKTKDWGNGKDEKNFRATTFEL